eukprot:TRINITY_DN592_c0_g1_i1.p1 TRINITY_DN592_c0_g1~~TRINITY_DN592_c0_g1_i1.p1  ORF type:complete len:389 (-),score=53.98 TRINITY_DN592_c0_g1_i1:171-1337(-)
MQMPQCAQLSHLLGLAPPIARPSTHVHTQTSNQCESEARAAGDSFLCLWVGGILWSEGQIPITEKQQLSLWRDSMFPVCDTWWYHDEEDLVTVAALADLGEACFFASEHFRGPDDVLHLHAKESRPLSVPRRLTLPRRKCRELRYRQHLLCPSVPQDQGQIEMDLPRTWLVKFLETGLAERELAPSARRVLVAFSAERPDIGYCQGMNSVAVAALITARWNRVNQEGLEPGAEWTLNCQDEAFAFGVMCSWVDDVLPPTFWASCKELHGGLPPLAAIQTAAVVVERVLAEREPALSVQLALVLPIKMFVERFLCGLFVGILPLTTTMRVWEVTMDVGAHFLILVCATIIQTALQPLLNSERMLDATDQEIDRIYQTCLLYTSPSPRDS